MNKTIISVFMMLLMASSVMAATYPVRGSSNWDSSLFQWLNESHNSDGTLKDAKYLTSVVNFSGSYSDLTNKPVSIDEDSTDDWKLSNDSSAFDTRLALKSTDDVAEGSNLYFTTTRAVNAVDAAYANLDTDSTDDFDGVYSSLTGAPTVVSSFTNDAGYYVSSNFNTDFDTRLGLKSTTNLAEGANLYYTDTRFDSRLSAKSTTNLVEGTNLYYTQARFDTAFGGKSTSDLSEGTNKYFTDARAITAVEGTGNTYLDSEVDSALALKQNTISGDLDLGSNSLIAGTVKSSTVSGTVLVQPDADSSGRVRFFMNTLGNPLFNVWGHDSTSNTNKYITFGVFDNAAYTETGVATARAIITSGGNTGASDRNALEIQSPDQVRITAVDNILNLGNVRIAADTNIRFHPRTDAETDSAKYLTVDTVGQVQGADVELSTNSGDLVLNPSGEVSLKGGVDCISATAVTVVNGVVTACS